MRIKNKDKIDESVAQYIERLGDKNIALIDRVLSASEMIQNENDRLREEIRREKEMFDPELVEEVMGIAKDSGILEFCSRAINKFLFNDFASSRSRSGFKEDTKSAESDDHGGGSDE